MRKSVSCWLRDGNWRCPQSKLYGAESFAEDRGGSECRTSSKRPWRRTSFFCRSSFGRSPARIGEQSKQSGSKAPRRRCARKPKWRMRTNPGGSTCSRNRRKEFADRQRDQTLLVFVSRIAPAESDGAIGKFDESIGWRSLHDGCTGRDSEAHAAHHQKDVSSTPPTWRGTADEAKPRTPSDAAAR